VSMQECVILRVASQHLENRMIASLPEAINQEQDKTWAPNHSLERTRPARRDNLKGPWPGRSARGR